MNLNYITLRIMPIGQIIQQDIGALVCLLEDLFIDGSGEDIFTEISQAFRKIIIAYELDGSVQVMLF